RDSVRALVSEEVEASLRSPFDFGPLGLRSGRTVLGYRESTLDRMCLYGGPDSTELDPTAHAGRPIADYGVRSDGCNARRRDLFLRSLTVHPCRPASTPFR